MGKLILPLTKTHGYADKIVQSSVPDKYIFILSNWKFLIIIGEMSDIKSLPSEARKTLVDNRRTKAIQKRLANTRNLRITYLSMRAHFHTLRHWKATMEYQRTRDILYVKKHLGAQKN